MIKQLSLRIGLMVPANNTTMERELPAWLPVGSTCRRIGIPRGKGMLTAESLPAYVGEALALARGFAGSAVDLVAYGCTAAGFLAGPERDAAIAAELGVITGRPVVTTASAMTAALRHIGARRIALVTPYQEFVNERLRDFLERSGIAVEALASFGAETVDELAAIAPEAIAAQARATMRPRCDALFIACSQLPTRQILPQLEREICRPAWSSIKATAWHALQKVEGNQGGVTKARNVAGENVITSTSCHIDGGSSRTTCSANRMSTQSS